MHGTGMHLHRLHGQDGCASTNADCLPLTARWFQLLLPWFWTVVWISSFYSFFLLKQRTFFKVAFAIRPALNTALIHSNMQCLDCPRKTLQTSPLWYTSVNARGRQLYDTVALSPIFQPIIAVSSALLSVYNASLWTRNYIITIAYAMALTHCHLFSPCGLWINSVAFQHSIFCSVSVANTSVHALCQRSSIPLPTDSIEPFHDPRRHGDSRPIRWREKHCSEIVSTCKHDSWTTTTMMFIVLTFWC